MTSNHCSDSLTEIPRTHFGPPPPTIQILKHKRTPKLTHSILSKTRLKQTTHNTAKNLDNIEAIILSHFHQETDILCLQELPSIPQLDSSLNLTMYCNTAPDNTHGVTNIPPNYLSTFSKQVKHPNTHGTLIIMLSWCLFVLVILVK